MAAIVVIAFGPLPLQNIGRWQGPTKDTLAFYDVEGTVIGGGDSHTLPAAMKFI